MRLIIALFRGVTRLLQHEKPDGPTLHRSKQVFGYFLVRQVLPIGDGNRASLPFHYITYMGISNDAERNSTGKMENGASSSSSPAH